MKTAPVKWTEAMDKELLEVVKKYGTNDWGAGTPPTGLVLLAGPTHSPAYTTVANAMSTSVSRNQVRERHGVLLPSAKKGAWTPEEDAKLVAAMGDADPLRVSWPRIARSAPGRNAKQCRDRCVWGSPIPALALNFREIGRVLTDKRRWTVGEHVGISGRSIRI